MTDQKKRLFANCDAKGEAAVRLWQAELLNQNTDQARLTLRWVHEWLAPYDQAARDKAEEAQKNALDIARSSLDAAWKSADAASSSAESAKTANLISTIAIVLSVIAIAATIIVGFMTMAAR